MTDSAALDLDLALRDGRVPVSGQPGYDLLALTVGPTLLCTVYRAEGDVPMVTFGVAARSRGAGKLWRLMHEASLGYGLRTSADAMPPTPWCAVRVELGIEYWLAAYEVEVATAWIERRHHHA